MSALEKYACGTLVRSGVNDVIYLITSVHATNEPEFGRYTILPLMNVAAHALGLHEDSVYTVTGIDLDSDYYIVGKFDPDILKNSVFNSRADDKEYPTPFETAFMAAYMSAYGSLKESFDKDRKKMEEDFEKRLTELEEKYKKIAFALAYKPFNFPGDDDDGK